MAAEDRIHAVVDPIVDELELELVDLTYGGGRLKIVIDYPDGLDTQRLTKATRMISHELDMQEPVNGSYTLEVSSPGVERPLRTPAHFARSVGEQVALKLKPNDEKLRRVKGELLASDDESVTVATDDGEITVSLEQIAKANTVFDWGPAPKPGSSKKNTGKNTNKAAASGSSNETPKGSES